MEIVPLSRRERERLVRREAILAAALAVFAEKGFAGATLDEVAERAEFGKGTLYNYFAGGKEEILFALIDGVYDEMVALIEAYFAETEGDAPIGTPGSPSTRAVFRGLLARLLAHFLDRQAVFVLLIKEAQRMLFDEAAHHAEHLYRLRERLADALSRPLEAAMDAGALRRHDPHAVAHLLLGNVHGYLMYATCAPEASRAAATPEKGADFITAILFDGLLTEPGRA